MVDPARPPEQSEPAELPPNAARPPDALPPYEVPTARKVVSSGLQLALTSTAELRRASIYIGLLLLGAFGPAIIALLLILGRLGDDAGLAFASILFGQDYGAPRQPALEAALLVVAIEALVGVALFFTISIDAQVMAISILGGRASDRPMRLWESIMRARQTFWRMAGAGTLVGLVSGMVQLLILGAMGGLAQSSEAAGLLPALISTLIVAPLAYVSTGIVLGDVGAMEALSRSWRLYNARKLLALVVVLFTFLTSAIQLFALMSGLDVLIRASEILQVSLTEGAVAFTTAVVLILAAVVAFGSLTFTIGAVVLSPQVAGFLGLTFYAGGLDKARVDADKPPAGFRYISRPMAVSMVVLAGVVALQVPAINAIPPPPRSVMLDELAARAATESDLIDVYGYPAVVDDPSGDLGASGPSDIDLVHVEAAFLGASFGGWILGGFDCADPGVACADPDAPDAFAEGAYLFLARGASPLLTDASRRVAVLFALENEVSAIRDGGVDPFGGASRVWVTRPGPKPTLELLRSQGDAFTVSPSAARSRWSGTDVYTLIPAGEILDVPIGWDVVALVEDASGVVVDADTLRPSWDANLRSWEYDSIFIDDFRGLG